MRNKLAILVIAILALFFGVQSNAQTVVTTPASCGGICDGTAKVVGASCNPSATFTYHWSNGATTKSIKDLCAGSGWVIVTNVLCGTCDTLYFNIIQLGAWGVATSTPEICGNHKGTAKFWVQDATAPITYIWSNGATTEEITGLAAGEYFVTATDANGCITTGYVVVENNGMSTTTTLDFEGCGSVSISGETFTADTVVTKHYISVLGCDSTVVWNIDIEPIPTDTLKVFWCGNGSVEFHGFVYDAVGMYEVWEFVPNGCNMKHILVITALPLSGTVVTEVHSCSNQGVVGYDAVTVDGCPYDSIVVTYLLQAQETQDTNQVCDYGLVGVTTTHGLGLNGCDSIHTQVNLPAPKGSTVTKTITTCNPNQAGSHLVQSNTCVSDTLVTTTYEPLLPVFVNVPVCNPDSSGLWWTIQKITASGCPYPEISVALYRAPEHKTVTATTCNPTSVGTTTTIVPNTIGCDSLVLTTVTSFQAVLQTENPHTICAGELFSFGGQLLTQGGIYRDTLTSISGCDSISVLFLTVLEAPFGMEAQTICFGEQVLRNGQVFDQSGTYSFVLENAAVNGCDSLTIFCLTVLPKNDTLFANLPTCDLLQHGDSSLVVDQDANGCDKVRKTTLFWKSAFHLTNEVWVCKTRPHGDWFVHDTIKIGDCWGTSDTIFYPNFGTVNLFEPTCNKSLDGELIAEAWKTPASQDSCDYWEYLYWQYQEPKSFHESATICFGESFQFHGNDLTVSGHYTELILNQLGCYDTLQLDLTVLPVIEKDTTVFVCQNEDYAFGATFLAADSTYVFNLPAQVGCDTSYRITVKSFQESLFAFVPDTLVLYAPTGMTVNEVDTWVNGLAAGDWLSSLHNGQWTLTHEDLFFISANDTIMEYVRGWGVQGPCGDTLEIYSPISVHLKKDETVQPESCRFRIYPNPSSVNDPVTMEVEGFFGNLELTISNSNGSVESTSVHSVNGFNETFQLNLPQRAGVWFVHIKDSKHNFTVRARRI